MGDPTVYVNGAVIPRAPIAPIGHVAGPNPSRGYEHLAAARQRDMDALPMPLVVPTPSGHQVVVPDWMQPAPLTNIEPPVPAAVIANIIGAAPRLVQGLGESAAGAVRDATLRQGVNAIASTMSPVPASSPLVRSAVDDLVAHVLNKSKASGRT